MFLFHRNCNRIVINSAFFYIYIYFYICTVINGLIIIVYYCLLLFCLSRTSAEIIAKGSQPASNHKSCDKKVICSISTFLGAIKKWSPPNGAISLTFEFVAMFSINAVILGILVTSVMAQDARGTCELSIGSPAPVVISNFGSQRLLFDSVRKLERENYQTIDLFCASGFSIDYYKYCLIIFYSHLLMICFQLLQQPDLDYNQSD